MSTAAIVASLLIASPIWYWSDTLLLFNSFSRFT